MATTTRRAGRDALVRELMQDYGCETEQELRMRLRTATAWANEHGVHLADHEYDGAPGPCAEVGRTVHDDIARVVVTFNTSPAEWKSQRHRRLVCAALALFLFTHPVTRRNIEAGRCSRADD
jgi:hypothetical protein